jgi:hypothetical protein
LPVRVDSNRHRVCERDPGNASDEGGGLRTARADANGVGLRRHAQVSDIDIVTARRKIVSGENA